MVCRDGVYVPETRQDPKKMDLRLRYLAGLWEFELPKNLLWYRTPRSVPSESKNGEWRYNGPYRAPTWSWASGVGAIDFETIPQEEQKDFLAAAEVINVEYRQKGADLHGDSASAALTLSSLMVEGLLDWTEFDLKIALYRQMSNWTPTCLSKIPNFMVQPPAKYFF